jgi:hypothetical protein
MLVVRPDRIAVGHALIATNRGLTVHTQHYSREKRNYVRIKRHYFLMTTAPFIETIFWWHGHFWAKKRDSLWIKSEIFCACCMQHTHYVHVIF